MVTPSERSGCDLLMQSAGLLILCHMREETTNRPAKIAHTGFVVDHLIRKIHVIHSIVRAVLFAVKSRRHRDLRTPGGAPIGTSGRHDHGMELDS